VSKGQTDTLKGQGASELEGTPNEFLERSKKLEDLREKGQAFPNDFRVEFTNVQFIETYSPKIPLDVHESETPLPVNSLAGRMVSKRVMGKAAFFHLRDRSGDLQVYLREDAVGPEVFQEFKKFDVGDILGVRGHAFRTKTKELTLVCKDVRLLTKALRPLPEKWHGLTDVETRYRQRYLDLISNPDARKIFLTRGKVIQYIRNYLTQKDYVEVETPMMQPIPGGAAAKPFVTHHNTLDLDLYLRIAPELYLKRLVVGGFERVFEINRNFRNEGISTQHNPEFTMIEFYQAYATFEDLIDLTQDMVSGLVRHLFDGKEEIVYQNETLSFKAPWRKVRLVDSVKGFFEQHEEAKVQGFARLNLEDAKDLLLIAEHFRLNDRTEKMVVGEIQLLLFEELVEATLKQPTFVTHYPISVSPLSRRNNLEPHLADRFELFIFGREIANAFSELNDPIDQAARFTSQLQKRELGDEEAMYFDEDFVRALEHGMPPTAGEGIGIDRLVMLMTNAASIREVILFPLLRPEKG